MLLKDPFPFPPIPSLSNAIRPLATHLNLTTLPLHIHEVLAAALLYFLIFYPISPILSHLLFPQHYSHLPRPKRLNWDAHVVSMVQACLINSLALWVMWQERSHPELTWEETTWGYGGAQAMVQSLAAGYFVWDLIVTSLNFDVFGIGTLAHAIAALFVFSLGFRPVMNTYACVFILWEMSTPFLNIHWFMDKTGMTGSRAQLYNGFALLGSFFSFRLVFGTYMSYRVFYDFFYAVGKYPSAEIIASSPLMTMVTTETTMPVWVTLVYLGSNMTLNCLNFYWFFKMISAVRKRFEPGAAGAKVNGKKEAIEIKHEAVTEAEVDLATLVEDRSPQPKTRRRKA